jgi:hypothetical protein
MKAVIATVAVALPGGTPSAMAGALHSSRAGPAGDDRAPNPASLRVVSAAPAA